MAQSDLIATIDQLTHQLLGLLGITVDSLTITPTDTDILTLSLKLPDTQSGILIGYHAETLTSLQRLLNLMAYQQLHTWHRIIVDINNYRESREFTLQDMARNAADRALLTGQAVVMPYLESFERRLIHMALANEPSVETISQGEGKDRRLVVRPRSDTHQ